MTQETQEKRTIDVERLKDPDYLVELFQDSGVKPTKMLYLSSSHSGRCGCLMGALAVYAAGHKDAELAMDRACTKDWDYVASLAVAAGIPNDVAAALEYGWERFSPARSRLVITDHMAPYATAARAARTFLMPDTEDD